MSVTSLPIQGGVQRGHGKTQLANRRGSYLAVKAIEAMLHNRVEKRAAVRAAIEEAGKGAFISQEAMDTWIASWDSEAELPPPEPDIGIR